MVTEQPHDVVAHIHLVDAPRHARDAASKIGHKQLAQVVGVERGRIEEEDLAVDHAQGRGRVNDLPRHGRVLPVVHVDDLEGLHVSVGELHQPCKDGIHGVEEGVANVAEPHVCQHADVVVVQDAMLLA